jgi:hypothetical protein
VGVKTRAKNLLGETLDGTVSSLDIIRAYAFIHTSRAHHAKGGEKLMARRSNLAQLVYGRRDPDPANVTSADDLELVEGRRPRATKLRVSKLERRCPTCTRPLSNERRLKNCDNCLARRNRKPLHADSLQEAAIFADPRSRRTLTAKGRLA